MRARSWFVVLLLVLLSTGCKKEEAAPTMEEGVSAPAAPAPADARSQSSESAPEPGVAQAATVVPQPASRKLIRRLDLELVAKDTEATAARLQGMVTSMGGYVSDVNASRNLEAMHYEMVLRVPAEKLDAAREEIRRMVLRVEREQMTTEDVTSQFVDSEARLRSLRATEDELRELLAESRERARKVAEVMEIYNNLTEVRTQIEQIQGQLNQLQGQVSFSTIHLTLEADSASKPIVAEDAWRPGETTRNAFRNLVGFLQWVVDALIVIVVNGIPIALVILIPVFLIRKIWRRWVGKPPAEPAAPTS
ncbi:MAG TPA: DUF4349 domain-containing protein [Thermoanaerobaculia bacterium]|jgi:hypothetical protein|nr:DUF4349 domain-containing protein [Thermoanaerobaculia bacterium]